MNFVSFSIHRPVATTMIILGFVVMGMFCYTRIPLDMLPKVDFPFITVLTAYPGADPENIETLVSKPIEDAVSAINGIDELRSDSYEGFSNVLIQFKNGVDVEVAANDVREKMGTIRSGLPDGAKEPIVMKFDVNALPILSIAIAGPQTTEAIYAFAKDHIKDELLKIDGVADINFIGGREREIVITVSEQTLKAYHLSIMSLAGLISQKSLNLPSGHLTQERFEYSIRLMGEFASVEEIRELDVPMKNGKTVKLKYLAEVTDSFEDLREGVTLDGQRCVGMVIKKRSDANTVRTAGLVSNRLTELEKRLPAGMKVITIRNRADFILNSINDLNSNMLMGLVITAVILFLFLHSLKSTIISAISIPVSVVATYTLMFFSNFSLNMMTLMGLAISIGILVNNAIIVVENIYVHLQRKKTREQAALDGTNEILVAVSAATLTNVVIFLPIAFMSGIIGQFFYEFGLTITFATFVSLLTAFFLTPMLAAFFLNPEDADPTKKSWFGRRWDALYEKLAADYQFALELTLRHKFLTLLICLGLSGATLLLAPRIGFEFVTEPDQHEFDITIKLPSGASLDNTRAAIDRIGAILKGQPEVQYAFAKLGKTESLISGSSQGTNLGEITVKLHSSAGSTNAFIQRIISDISTIPSIEVNMKQVGLMGSSESPLQIDINGDDLDGLKEIANKVLAITRETKNTRDVISSLQEGKPEVKITPLRAELARCGISEAFLAMSLRSYYEGNIPGQYRELDDEYDIRLKLPEQSRQDISQVKELLVLTQDGRSIPLSQVAQIEETTGPAQINRKSRNKTIKITANVAGRSLGEVLQDIQARTDKIELPLGYSIEYAGTVKRMNESFGNLATAFGQAVLFTYMLLAALIESFIHPLSILVSVPLAFPGIILGLFLTGKTVSIFSLMAVVMLVGIVVNNGILLIESFRQNKSEGMDTYTAVIQGAPSKLRPIIMTTLASVAAMIPLAVGMGEGSEMQSAMAVVSIGGLLVSGFFVMFVFPIVYYLVEVRLLGSK